MEIAQNSTSYIGNIIVVISPLGVVYIVKYMFNLLFLFFNFCLSSNLSLSILYRDISFFSHSTIPSNSSLDDFFTLHTLHNFSSSREQSLHFLKDLCIILTVLNLRVFVTCVKNLFQVLLWKQGWDRPMSEKWMKNLTIFKMNDFIMLEFPNFLFIFFYTLGINI